MNLHKLYELNLKIKKGEASNQEKEKYKIEYEKIKEYYILAHDGLYPFQFETMILPESIDNMNYDVITKYVDIFENEKDYGKWYFDNTHKRTSDDPIQMPFTNLSKNVHAFIKDFYDFRYIDFNYLDNHKNIEDKSIEDYTVNDIFTELTFYIRGERFCEGLLLEAFNDGTILKLLKALREG